MENLTKTTMIHDCSLNDVIECLDNLDCGISAETRKNWERLNTKTNDRLLARANKRKSQKRIVPLEYFTDKKNVQFVQNILDIVDVNNHSIISVVLSLGIKLLKIFGIYGKEHVSSVLRDYSGIELIKDLVDVDLPKNEYDLLGIIYQSYLKEGKKNIIGSYYTPQSIASNMTKKFDFSCGQEFFDPCCGSGSFLLSLNVSNPEQIYGIDNDAVAVLIAKINLLIKYKDNVFYPNVYCLDYLRGYSLIQQNKIFLKKFDYIATNPPWGAMDSNWGTDSNEISSKETFSCFFVKSFQQLKRGGTIRFLFPESILNVKTHKDIRSFILDKAGLISITSYDNTFTGVTTNYVDIECGESADKEHFYLHSTEKKSIVSFESIYETENRVFNLLHDNDISIVHTVKKKGVYFLQNSEWALGIVTGNNKDKLFSECGDGMEPIYTGKEISPYRLKPVRNYLIYDRKTFQQVAKEEMYRAPEKLVYKFISSKLVFAYDRNRSLFLNSANILIPKIPGMCVRAVLAFLNSMLFRFMYMKLFGEVKILKGNLCELPFPEISREEDCTLSKLVDCILAGDDSKREKIDKFIYSLYGFTEPEIMYIERCVNGKLN